MKKFVMARSPSAYAYVDDTNAIDRENISEFESLINNGRRVLIGLGYMRSHRIGMNKSNVLTIVGTYRNSPNLKLLNDVKAEQVVGIDIENVDMTSPPDGGIVHQMFYIVKDKINDPMLFTIKDPKLFIIRLIQIIKNDL